MRVRIDAGRCTGHGRCYTLAPEVFEPDDRGLGLVSVLGDLPAQLEPSARKAQANCPEQAIELEG